jgi:cyanophycin synthetase
MIDFAHNPDGFRGIRDFLATVRSPHKIGIITGTGDRRDSDLLELGSLSAQMFDHIIISQRKFLRGRSADEIVDFLVRGIQSWNPDASYEYISDETEPFEYALSIRQKDSFICALSDVLNKPIELITSYIEMERSGKQI